LQTILPLEIVVIIEGYVLLLGGFLESLKVVLTQKLLGHFSKETTSGEKV
jgi:hypothetical protein